MKYSPREIEPKWQKYWEESGINRVDLDSAKKPFYNLMMFPYPSAEGLHVGNMYAFTHSDAFGRFMKLKGFDVFEPIGLDGFGIHSENYAIKIKEHIKDVSKRTEKHFYEQLHMIGNQYDWSRKVETYKPEYYKWTQWLFLQMYKKGLAYRAKAPVNWCPSCKTVLSDEQIVSACCERCGTQTEKRQMEQWFFKITDYAERLLNNLDKIDWPEDVKTIQRNWIGKTEGINITYDIENLDKKITVYTTRPDTNFGATFIVVAPESDFVRENLDSFKNKEEIQNYIAESRKKSDIERIAEGRKKTGVSTGLNAINNLNGRRMPIYVSDFVLATVGTGAVVGVPGHDARDFEFAKEKELEIIRVVIGSDGDDSLITNKEQVQEESGKMVNSDFLDGMEIMEAKEKIKDYIEEKGWGKRAVNYKLRDWCVSRQRYWGPPIPIIYCDKCGIQPVPEKDLPVSLPEMEDFLPDGSGKGPLNKNKDFVETTCPVCGGAAKRETDVSDPFVDSCWYYLRYTSTDFDDKPFDKERLSKWMPVNMYIGGKEHAVLHLLYSRFVSMVMKDLGYLKEEEPFKRFFAHGLLIRDGAKMSKSKGNVINPDEYIKKFGADSVRSYLMFMGDVRLGGDWRDEGMNGMFRFMNRVWNISQNAIEKGIKETKDENILKASNRAIKRVGEHLEKLKFNTAISGIMEYVNSLYADSGKIGVDSISILAQLIASFAPHLAEEIWEQCGNKPSVFQNGWPQYDENLIKEDQVEIPVQVNGKMRGKIFASPEISQEEAMGLAMEDESIKKWLSGNEPKKVIFVAGKMLNIVI